MRRCRLAPLTIVFVAFCMAMLVVASPPAYGQAGGTSSTLSGLVTDSSGAIVPGASVVVKNNATAAISQTVTDGSGGFAIPALQPGTYTVTVTLQGFKTFSAPDVKLVAATPARIKAVLEVGNLEETVVVQGATELVQTQTAAVQTTIVVQQIQQLPLVTHTALDYVVNLPGVSLGVNGGSRASTINGLNNANINITLDGVNVQDNNNRNGDGFFMYIRPMMDSVEEITVSASTPEAASAAQGAQQIRMVTRSGGNRFSGSAYDTWRNQAGTDEQDVLARTKHPSWLWGLNTPYWFNIRDRPKTAAGDYFIDDVRLATPGFRVGGPIMKDKMFFFFNSEWFLLPQTVARTRYILTPDAQAGRFSYPAADGTGVKTVNLYSIAGGSADPTIAKLLADIRAAAGSEGSIGANDENTQAFYFNPSATQKRVFPTLRLDYNLTSAHRLTFSTRYNMFRSSPDFLNNAEAQFPGFPAHGAQDSDRFMWQASLRSTFGKNVVNEARVGWQGAFGKGTTWFNDMSADGSFGCSSPGCESVGGKPFLFDISTAASGITNAATIYSNSARLAPAWVYEDSVTWLKGKHSISAGASYSRFWLTQRYDVFVPPLGFTPTSLETGPYNALDASSGNFPGGIDDTYANYARNLYWVLTGRVTSIGNSSCCGTVAYLNPSTGKYTFPGTGGSDPYMDEWGFFISDQWRLKPNLTLNLGLRYELQPPFTTTGSNFARLQSWQMVYGATGAGSGSVGQGNLFHPGTLTGAAPVLEAYPKNDPGWNTDWNNLAPSIGAAWRPTIKGFLSKILSPEPVLRGGYSISYSRQALASLTGVYGNNPGRQVNMYRTDSAGNPVMGYDGWPVLVQQVNRLTPATFSDTPSYPKTPATNDSVWAAYPDLKVPYTHQWSAGFQRELGKSMAIELRYVGNKNVGTWTNWNVNGSANFSMLAGENGFYDEFRKAQANLRANIIAGKGNTFAYTGATGTSALPIFMAFFQGYPLNDPRNADPANYTNSKFKSSSWYNPLSMYAPAIGTTVGSGSSGLRNSAFAANAAAAGLPANFFMANPAVYQTSSNLLVNGGAETFHGLQLELRRRIGQGVMFTFAYQAALSQKGYNWRSLREEPIAIDATRTPTHGLKLTGILELPFGQGKRFASNVSRFKNMFVGGWEIDGVFKWNTGTLFNYGGYRLVGMSEQEFQDMFKFYHVADTDGKDRIYMLPQDVITNSILAISKVSAITASGYSGAAPTGKYLAPASGPDCVQYLPGQCPGTSLSRIITGPSFAKLDMAFVKRFAVGKNMHFEARMDLYNITNAINFNATSATGANVRDWQVTGAYADINANQDAGGRTTMFSLRFNF